MLKVRSHPGWYIGHGVDGKTVDQLSTFKNI